MMKRVLFGIALASVLSAISLTAATKGSTDPSTIILNPPAGASEASIQPHLGEYVTFTVTYPKTLQHYGVRIQLICYDTNGQIIYGEAGPFSQPFLLGGAMSIWYQTDGPAQCRADLYYWSYNGGQKWNGLAYTNFDALGR